MPIALFFLSFNASAITDAERDELSRLHNELVQLQRIIKLAKKASDKSDTHQFNYLVLEKELNAIKQGVEDSLNMIRREPKVQTNVTGEY